MTETLRFGPEWLRQLSGGSMTSPPPSPSFGLGGKYKLADHRYGREEMLSLFSPTPKAPDDLKAFPTILVETCQEPMALIPPTDEERRLLNSSVNSAVFFRSFYTSGRGGGNERGPPGMRGTGRGGVTRGRGRGRGDRTDGFYGRGGFDEGQGGRGEMFRSGRGGAPTKVIERDSSGFLSARSYDENLDRRKVDPFSRSTPTDRWSDLRSGGGSGSRNESDSTQTDDNDTDWRRAGRDRNTRFGMRRDKAPSFDDDRNSRGFSRQMSYERRNISRHDDGDELPEWATDDMAGGDEGGTFDASGAFLSLKDIDESDKKKTEAKTINKSSKDNDKPVTGSPQGKEPAPSNDTKSQSPKKSGSPVTEREPEAHNPSNSENSESLTTDQTPTTTANNQNSTDSHEKSSPTAAPNPQPKQSEPTPSVDTKTYVDPDADFDHLTKAAEQMMANWAAEDDEDIPPAKSVPVTSSGGNTESQSPTNSDSWYYQDPQGTLQGPFAAQEMAEWFSAGYFTMTLLVKRGKESTFMPLGEIIKRNGGRQPFIPSTPTTIGLPTSSVNLDPLLMANSSPGVDTTAATTGLQHTPYLLPQQLFALQQQQQQQQQLYLQQVQLQEIIQRLKSSEKYSHLTAHQMQLIATKILMEDKQKQALLMQQRAGVATNSGQQPSPPLMANVMSHMQPSQSIQPPQQQDDDYLWGAANRSWKMQMRDVHTDELTQNEAVRRQAEMRELKRKREEVERARRELEEKQRQIDELERQKQLDKQQELERQRELEKQLELERMRELERQREVERRHREELERQRELERQKELERQRELEHQRELEKQRELQRQQEFERQREFERQEQEKRREMEQLQQELEKQKELKRQKEAQEKKLREEEAQRQLETQRREAERLERERIERERQAEKEQLEALKLPSTAQWASTASSSPVPFTTQQSLQEIQKKEQEREEKERAVRLIAEQKQREQELLQQQQQNQTQLKWASAASQPAAPTTAAGGKSLREIQEEEARRLEIETKERNKQKAALAASTPLATAATWGAKSGGWANEGAWGNSNRKWDTQNAAVKSSKTVNSDVFPSLSSTSNQSKQPSSQPAPKKKQQQPQQQITSSSKKSSPNEKVQKLFQTQLSNKTSDDKFLEWCTKSLSGLNASIDVPTFVSFLREVESPFEVQDYVKSYLGDTPRSAQFAKDFLEKRSSANKQKQRHDDEESLWGPAPAVNPNLARNSSESATTTKSGGAEKKKKNAKKGKAQKMDATSLLGFTVGASSSRLNVGEIDKPE